MLRSLSEGWLRFWFRPEPTATLAVVRIAYGLVVGLWAASLAPDLHTFYSSSGIDGTGQSGASEFTITAVYVLLVAGSVCLMLGLHARLAAAVVFLAVLWFQGRNPWILNAGDRLLANLGFYLILAPSGAALSLDRWRQHPDDSWECPSRAPWALRLVQIQVSLLYLSTVWERLQGTRWPDGTAVSYALRIGQLVRVEVPAGVTDSILVVSILTWSTLAVELSLALLVWSGRLRPWVLACGVVLHLCIELTMTVGFFGVAALVAYLAFVPSQTTQRAVTWLRRHAAEPSPNVLALACTDGPFGSGQAGHEPQRGGCRKLAIGTPRSTRRVRKALVTRVYVGQPGLRHLRR